MADNISDVAQLAGMRRDSLIDTILMVVERGISRGGLAQQQVQYFEEQLFEVDNFIREHSQDDGFVTKNVLETINRILKTIRTMLRFRYSNVDRCTYYLGKMNSVLRTKVAILEKEEVMEKIEDELNAEVIKTPVLVEGSNYTSPRAVVKMKKADLSPPQSRPLERFTCYIDLYIVGAKDSQSLNCLLLVLEALSAVEGVTAELTDIRKGSLWGSIKAQFRGPKAQKNTEDLLDGVKNLALGKLGKDYEEMEKTKAEKAKILAEMENDKSEYAKRKKDLEIEGMELANKKERLALTRMEFDFLTDRVEFYKRMLAESIITQEQFRMAISGKTFIDTAVDLPKLSGG